MQAKKITQWQIIGSGAIGCLWAANLIKSGQKVHLVSRHQNLSQTLQYENLQGKKITFNCPQSHNLNNSNGPILVCVKAPQVKQALLDQKPFISAKQAIILMHNGMGPAEQIASIFPDNPIICATTANASLLDTPFNIKQTGLGITYLGAFNKQANAYSTLLAPLNQALDNCHWSDKVEITLWLKLLINIAINPLTAIHQIKNGALSAPFFQKQIEMIVDEALPVLSSIKIASHQEMKNIFSKENLLITINTVISSTAKNYSSMNRDIYYQRPTENDYISGYLLKKASQHHIETPFINECYQQILNLESHYHLKK